MKMSNYPATFDVLIKQRLSSILDIGEICALSQTKNGSKKTAPFADAHT